jgi:outer membrane receptor for ferrienterochelin and colicins
MMRKHSLFVLLVLFNLAAFCQTAIVGKVKDEITGQSLAGATVLLENTKHYTISDKEGRFQLQLSTGTYSLIITYVGYQPFIKKIDLEDGETKTVDAILFPDTYPGHEVVVSASLKPEKIYEAAAAIHLINRKSFERFAGSNPLELMSTVPGLEYTRSGVSEITINARGLHSAFNNRVLQIIDGRNSMAALSGTLPVMNRSTIIKDDIERLEIVLGPQSAIYGPNSHNAVFNFVTKDPRKHPGTSLSASAGNRSQFSTRLRHAYVINNKWAYKITLEHATGRDYEFYDSIYAGNQPPGNTPFFGPAVTIPARIKDFGFKTIRGEGSVYYSMKPGTDIIISGGSSEHNFLQVTTGGRNQMQGIIYSFVQARLISERWYASIYNTWGSLGDSYLIGNYTRDYWNRTHSSLPSSDLNRGRLSPDSAEIFALRLGNRFKEKSQRLNAELRHHYNIPKAGLYLGLGFNFQEERPNGYGITLIDSFHRIRVRQGGLAAQGEKQLPYNLRLVSAVRLDHHQNFGSFLSPRIALIKMISQGAFRLSWSRAYSMPTIQNQYAGIGRILFGNGGGILYLPNEQNNNNEMARIKTSPLQPERISTWEAGFKGALSKKIYVDVNYHYGISRNFISPSRTVGGRVYEVNGIRVTHNPLTAGTVMPDGTLKGASFSTWFNYGEVSLFGLDLAMKYAFNRKINLLANYSWFGSDITKNHLKNDANSDGYVSLEETSLNAPRNRGLLTLQFERIMDKNWYATVSARMVEQYDFYSGAQIGTSEGRGKRGIVPAGVDANGNPRNYLKNFDYGALGGFTTIDLSTGYDLNEKMRINLGITNLLDTRQVEFVSSPSIGRLIMVEVRISVL